MSKFNKKKCKSCKWHGTIHGINDGSAFCNYGAIHEKTCLHRLPGGRVVDRRGKNKDACKLYEKGKNVRIGWTDADKEWGRREAWKENKVDGN